jgi:hypothetical protein
VLPILVLGLGWARLVAGLGVDGAASILVGLLLLGRSGRETLLTMFKPRDQA